ncbi:hypothetical protein LGN07_09640 [Burkholderia cepacia]|uniref:hypothetical protein n=1 Tax=Burkholderia cepacia TaxID=292 RepID=UPI0012D96679|nr:hypothetical protein [Burkholderia cepacia]MCA8118978.1 hypothetical protein [Burkholderia cepacia]
MAREPAHVRLRDYGRLARQRRTRARSSRRHRIVGRMRERERIFAGIGNDTSTDVDEPVERFRRVLEVLRRAPDAFPRAAVRVIRVRILRITPDGARHGLSSPDIESDGWRRIMRHSYTGRLRLDGCVADGIRVESRACEGWRTDRRA